VSFCEPSSLSIFSICNETINPLPKQTISEANAQLSRPEDVKISPDGSYCAVTNSDKNNIAFYRFDKHSNSIPDINPFYFLQNPESRLVFPHGLAFSIDEKYLAVTQFGHVQITEEGDIFWNPTTPSSEGIINLYLLNH
jgi:DNA-binding beta-propeller fold protein YncE